MPEKIEPTDSHDRTHILRQRCLERKGSMLPWDGDARLAAISLKASENCPSWTIRRGLLTRDLLRWTEFDLDDQELLAGRLAPDRAEWQAERKGALVTLGERTPHLFTPGQAGHCQLDLSRLFTLGMDGLKETLKERGERAAGKTAEVYQSFYDALDGLSVMAENAARAAEAARENASDQRAAELDAMAVACRNVAHVPPSTFYEALQLTWLAILGCQVADRAWLVSPGHLDRTLWPYYQADTRAGRLTPDLALRLVEALYLLINETVPDGLAVAVMVGGRDAAGADLTNPLSYFCLEALRSTRLVYPTVGICWHAGTPQDLSDLALDLITHGIANPAFFGDETIQRGLRQLGVPAEEACDYVNSTCVEITPCGSSNVWVASPYFSTCKLLLDEIAEQAQTGSADETFDAFLASYRQRLSGAISAAVAEQNQNRQARQAYGGKPLQSVFTRDCIERGRDIDDGGARYNWAECSFVGLANLADSLYVLREEVFNQKRLSLAELNRMLGDNFQGHEAERLRFLNGYPKYGNNRPEVDCLVGEVVTYARQECSRYPVDPDNSPYVPGAFCWIMHEQLGRECGATPDGRRAGFPFADGCGPAQGREAAGPTAAVLSVTSWDAAALIGGAAFNMKFGASLFTGPGPVARLRDLAITFLKLGGFETQINVVDARVLVQAQADPEAYRDLVVRIGGYTDYFTRLSPQMQAELILRTEYGEI